MAKHELSGAPREREGGWDAAEEAPVSERSDLKVRPDEDPRTTAFLILVAVRESAAHLGRLLRLARIEIRGNLRALAALVLLFGAALLLVLVTLALLLIALRDALAVLLGNEALASLIVALPFLAATAILTWAGVRRMSLRASRA